MTYKSYYNDSNWYKLNQLEVSDPKIFTDYYNKDKPILMHGLYKNNDKLI